MILQSGEPEAAARKDQENQPRGLFNLFTAVLSRASSTSQESRLNENYDSLKDDGSSIRPVRVLETVEQSID